MLGVRVKQLMELGLVVEEYVQPGSVNRLSNRHTTSLDRRHITRLVNTLFGTYLRYTFFILSSSEYLSIPIHFLLLPFFSQVRE